MTAKSNDAAVQKARELWQRGMMRKFIAAETGLSERTVSRVCGDLPKPVEYRGRKVASRTRAALARARGEKP
jgi:hypothetical protein